MSARYALTPDEQEVARKLVAEWMPWLESKARYEAQHRAGRIFIVLDFSAEPPPFVTEGNESTYRRGYHQGYSAALDDVVEHGPGGAKRSRWWVRLVDFYEGPLWRWRRAEHGGSFDLPPRLTIPVIVVKVM
jgi:hypothetical protein